MLNHFNSYLFRILIIKNVFKSTVRKSNWYIYNTAFHRTFVSHKSQVFQKTNPFLQEYHFHISSFHFKKDFHNSSIKNQNDNSEIGQILSSLENKLLQLGMVNGESILDVINKLEESADLIMESDLLKVSNLITEALQRDMIKNPIIIEKFGKLLLSFKDLQSLDELLCNFLHMCLKGKSFPYEEILSFMENNNLWCQKVCELLVSNLCHWEMTDEIAHVFSKMKSLNISLNENIYTSMILLYGKKRDLNKVHELVSSMEEDHCQSFSSSQSALIMAYNICGEYEKARTILEEFEDLDRKLESDQFNNILISAIENDCYNNNLDYLSYIVNLKNSLTEGADLKKLINYLLTSNYLKEAVFLLSMEKKDEPSRSYYSTPSADFVREIIKLKENDSSAVILFCYELVRSKVNEYAFEIALENSLSTQNSNLSFELLKYLKSKRQLNENLFWPLFVSKADSSTPNLEKTLETVDKMRELEVNIGKETLMNYIIPSLPLDEPEISLEMLVKHGLGKSKVISPLLATLITMEKYEEVYVILKNNRIPFILNSLLFIPLAKTYCRDQKVATELLLSLYQNGLQEEISDKSRVIDQFATYVHRISKRKISINDVLFYFKEIENEDFFMPSSSSRDLSRTSCTFEKTGVDSLGEDSSQTDEEVDTLGSLSKGKYSKNNNFGRTFHASGKSRIDSQSVHPFQKVIDKFNSDISENRSTDEEISALSLRNNNHYNKLRSKKYLSTQDDPEENITSHMSIEELEGHLIELKSKGMNVRGVLRRLLLKHSSIGNQQRVKEISEELEKLDADKSAGMISSTMYNKVLEGNADAALKELNNLYENYPDFVIDSYKVIDLCSLCARMGKMTDSLEIIRKHIKVQSKNFRNCKGILHNCYRLLNDCSNAGGYSFVREMCSTLLSGGLIKPSVVIFGPLIKAKLQENDLVGAVEETEEIFHTHNILALRIELLKKILESDEDDRKVESLVERVVKLISESKGSSRAKQDLLSAALHAENEELASKVLKHSETELNKESLRRMCNYYVKLENVRGLQILLKISKGSACVDRIHIYDSLLNIYFVNRNTKDAINLSVQMQEESLTPSTTFSRKFEALLKTTGSSSSAMGTLL